MQEVHVHLTTKSMILCILANGGSPLSDGPAKICIMSSTCSAPRRQIGYRTGTTDLSDSARPPFGN